MSLFTAVSLGPVEAVIFLVILFACWLIPGYFSGKIAREKGYNYPLFFILGLIFGLVMLVIVWVMPRRALARTNA